MAIMLVLSAIPAIGLTEKAYAADTKIINGVQQQGVIKKNSGISYQFVVKQSGKVDIKGYMSKASDEIATHRLVRFSIAESSGGDVLWSDSAAAPQELGANGYFGLSCYLNSGTYTLSMQGAMHADIRYVFTLSDHSAGESFPEGQNASNNTFDAAHTVALNKTYKSLLSCNDDLDFFKFTVPSSGCKRIIFNTLEGMGPDNVALYRGDRVRMNRWYGLGGEININDEVVELTAGTYFLRLERHSFGSGGVYSFQIADPISIAKTSIKLSDSSYTYDGYAKTPSVTITYNGSTLTNSRSYTVSYSANKSAGIGKVKVTGKGAYAGSVTKTFKIKPSRPSIKAVKGVKKGFKATWAKKSKAEATGYQVQYSTKKSMKGAKTKVVKGTSKTIKGLKAGKRYYVRVRAYKTVGKQKIYSSWSAKRSVTTKRR